MARPREFDEDTVVAKALDRFWTAGYRATSITDLLRATGLSRGSLYAAFGDKRGLFLRALDAYCADVLAAVHAALDGDDQGAAGRLVSHVRHVADHCGAGARGCFLAKSVSELAASDPEVALRADGMYGSYEEVVLTCVTQAQRVGAIDRGHEPRALAALLIITVRGMEGLDRAAHGPEFIRQVADHSVAFITDSGHPVAV
ncbi:TetR/AcrR family transcriptional regulator [Streptomyces tendae]|uniref:TetR/AcrR family transcriptional regulator n=1 Tax=Streptomyces tendae TaxID=1932 RepID=UPI0037A067D2